MDKYLLDTNILYEIDFLHSLKSATEKGHVEVYVPALVHVERIHQTADLYGDRFSIDTVHQFLQDHQFQILPLDEEHAEAVANLWIAIKSSNYFYDGYWEKNRFDIVVCAVAHVTGYTLITEDKGRHFDLVKHKNIAEVSRCLDELLVDG